ncbi:MAG: putative toxin-antitoxin system toxin component, PIN family, partial [bacterium]
PAILEEYRGVPARLYEERKITREQLTALIAAIAAFVAEAHVVEPKSRLSLCRDPMDNHVLECCLAARADVLLTGDLDLLEMDTQIVGRDVPGLRIHSPRSFLGVP